MPYKSFDSGAVEAWCAGPTWLFPKVLHRYGPTTLEDAPNIYITAIGCRNRSTLREGELQKVMGKPGAPLEADV